MKPVYKHNGTIESIRYRQVILKFNIKIVKKIK